VLAVAGETKRRGIKTLHPIMSS